MEKHKAIILGLQCSGKTTLKRYLESKFDLPLLEDDELFTELNDGEYPSDTEYKEKTLRPMLNEKIKSSDNIVFLTTYIEKSLLKELKEKDFKVIQINLERDEFNRRNIKRMKEEGYDDANQEWTDDIFKYHKEVRDEGLVDKVIEADKPVEEIADELVSFLSNQTGSS
jgi:adenylate kinase family enzyme